MFFYIFLNGVKSGIELPVYIYMFMFIYSSLVSFSRTSWRSTSHISLPFDNGAEIWPTLDLPSSIFTRTPLTYSPRLRYLYPSTRMSLWWQNSSSPVELRANPYPLRLLNHFTWNNSGCDILYYTIRYLFIVLSLNKYFPNR